MEEAIVNSNPTQSFEAAPNSNIATANEDALLCREVMQSSEQNQISSTALEDTSSRAAAVQNDQCLTGRDIATMRSDDSNIPINSETRRSENINHPVLNSDASGEHRMQSEAGAGKLPESDNAAPTKRRTAAADKNGIKDGGRLHTNRSPAQTENGDPTLQSILPVSLEEDALCGRTAIRLRAAAVSCFDQAL